MTYETLPNKTTLKLKDIVQMPNVAAKLSEAELLYYGAQAFQGYQADRQTRTEWESRNEKAIK